MEQVREVSDMISQSHPTTPICPMSLAGQLILLAIDVERVEAESVKRAEAEARYKEKMRENALIHKASRQVQAERRVLAMLCKQPGPVSTAELAHKLGQDRGSARYALMRLVERGKACNVGSQKRQLWIATERET